MTELVEKNFEGIVLSVRPDEKHEWLLTTKEVAEGYGVDAKTIRGHKDYHFDEIIEGEHFVRQLDFQAHIQKEILMWTKEGVVQLGYFIKSERAKQFRKWATKLIINKLEEIESKTFVPTTLDLAIKLHKESIEKVELYGKWIETLKRNDTLTKQVDYMIPKAQQHDTYLSSENTISVERVAKIFSKDTNINMGRNKMFEFLRNENVLMKGNSWNLPYQKYIDTGYFEVIEVSVTIAYKNVTKPTTRVTPRGVEYIYKSLLKAGLLSPEFVYDESMFIEELKNEKIETNQIEVKLLPEPIKPVKKQTKVKTNFLFGKKEKKNFQNYRNF